MEKFVLRTFCVIALGALAACAPATNPDELGSDKISPSSTISGQLEKADDGTLSGHGTLLFSQTLASTTSTIALDFDGGLNENGLVEIVSHATDRLLGHGVKVRFIRQGIDVTGEIQIGLGATIQKIRPERLSTLMPNRLAFTLEVRNVSGGNTQILLWPLETPKKDDSQALFNSADAKQTDVAAATKGPQGTYVGIRLQEARVRRAILR